MNFVGITSQSGLGHMPRGVLRVLWPPIFSFRHFQCTKRYEAQDGSKACLFALKTQLFVFEPFGNRSKKTCSTCWSLWFSGISPWSHGFLHSLVTEVPWVTMAAPVGASLILEASLGSVRRSGSGDGPWYVDENSRGARRCQVSSNFQGTHFSPIATSRTAGVHMFLPRNPKDEKD